MIALPTPRANAQSVGASGNVSDFKTGTAVWFNYPTDPVPGDEKSEKPRRQVPALIGVNIGEGTVWGYCIEGRIGPSSDGSELKITEWDQYGGVQNVGVGTNLLSGPDAQERREKINWIVHNSYPYLFPAEMGLADVSIRDVLAGTQAAIWHFSDGMSFTFDRSDQQDVKRVYEKLIGAENVGRSLTDRVGVGGLPLEGIDQDIVAVPPPAGR